MIVSLTFDMIILPVAVGANTSELSGLGGIFKGQFTDFNDGWYDVIGRQVLGTMTIFAFQSVIDFIVERLTAAITMKLSKRGMKKTAEAYKLATNEVQNELTFIDQHVGPEYLFYFKAANCIILTCTCLIFGPAFPIFYFIGFVGIGVTYLMERLTLAYFYRIPKQFDEKLVMQNLRFMNYLPVFSLGVTFWLYTNRQMFGNDIYPLHTRDEVTFSNHNFNTAFSDLSAAHIVLLVLIPVILAIQILDWCYNFAKQRNMKKI